MIMSCQHQLLFNLEKHKSPKCLFTVLVPFLNVDKTTQAAFTRHYSHVVLIQRPVLLDCIQFEICAILSCILQGFIERKSPWASDFHGSFSH